MVGGEVLWDAPVLIVGTPRSGTGHLVRTLNAHPQLAITDESYVMMFLYLSQTLAGLPANKDFEAGPYRLLGLVSRAYQPLFADLHLEHLHGFLRTFYSRSFAGKDVTRWGDKMVLGADVIPQILPHFPRAQFIRVVRDGRDAVCSLRDYQQRQIARNPHARRQTFEQICSDWADLNRGYETHLAGCSTVIVRYEDLVSQPRLELQRVCDFLGVPLAGQMEAYFENPDKQFYGRHATSASPSASVGRWQSELSADELSVFDSQCRDVLVALGYD